MKLNITLFFIMTISSLLPTFSQAKIVNLNKDVIKVMDLLLQKDVKECFDQIQGSAYPLKAIRATKEIKADMKKYGLTEYQIIFNAVVDDMLVGTAKLQISEKVDREPIFDTQQTTYNCQTQISEIR